VSFAGSAVGALAVLITTRCVFGDDLSRAISVGLMCNDAHCKDIFKRDRCLEEASASIMAVVSFMMEVAA
jgi:hypothetical protein